MTIINLRDFYYWYTQDEYMEVTDDVAEALRASVRYEAAYQRRLSRHKAQYSLDCEDGIEYSACLRELTPDEVLELKERFCRLWNALNSLPRPRAAGWMPALSSARAFPRLRWPRALTKARCGGPWSAGWRT